MRHKEKGMQKKKPPASRWPKPPDLSCHRAVECSLSSTDQDRGLIAVASISTHSQYKSPMSMQQRKSEGSAPLLPPVEEKIVQTGGGTTWSSHLFLRCHTRLNLCVPDLTEQQGTHCYVNTTCSLYSHISSLIYLVHSLFYPGLLWVSVLLVR